MYSSYDGWCFLSIFSDGDRLSIVNVGNGVRKSFDFLGAVCLIMPSSACYFDEEPTIWVEIEDATCV